MDERIGDITKIANNAFFIFLGLLFYLFFRSGRPHRGRG